MPLPKNDLTVEFVRSIFYYNEETAQLFWKKPSEGQKYRGSSNRIGKEAGRVMTNGYRYVHINGRWYLTHRLIYLHKTGSWPFGKIDHATGNILNNKKIRPADDSQSCMNRGKSPQNTSGFKGVSWHAGGKKWRAQIVAYGQHQSLGLHTTKEAAYAAYCKAAKELHGEFANFG